MSPHPIPLLTACLLSCQVASIWYVNLFFFPSSVIFLVPGYLMWIEWEDQNKFYFQGASLEWKSMDASQDGTMEW